MIELSEGARKKLWNDLLVGKKIEQLNYVDGRLAAFQLDSGLEVEVIKNENGVPTLRVEVEDEVFAKYQGGQDDQEKKS